MKRQCRRPPVPATGSFGSPFRQPVAKTDHRRYSQETTLA